MEDDKESATMGRGRERRRYGRSRGEGVERESVKREVLSVIERRGMGKIEGEREGESREWMVS